MSLVVASRYYPINVRMDENTEVPMFARDWLNTETGEIQTLIG